MHRFWRTLSDPIRLYGHYVSISLRGQMQYRASCVMNLLGTALANATEFVGLWALFARFGSLRGWRLAEVAVFYGLVTTAFALAEAFARGFDLFPDMIRRGTFDRVLLRPRRAALQVAAETLPVHRAGRLAIGLGVLVWATRTLEVHWSAGRIAVLLVALAGGACLFAALFILQAATAFWTIEPLEVWNTVTYGGSETGQFPLTIYRPWFRRFFTFVVPLAAVTYFPALVLLDRPDVLGSPRWFQAAAPAIGLPFLALSLAFWTLGVRHYRSTGS